MKTARVWLFLLCWGASSFVASARAQEPQEADAYRAAVEEALSEYAAKNYEEASALFSRAHALFPNARTLRGLGMAAFELRRYGESIRHLRAALDADVKPLDQALRDETEELLRRARGFVAEIVLRVEPESARVSLDGAQLAHPPPEPLVLSLGEHVFAAEATGYAPLQRSVRVRGGESLRLDLQLAPSASAASERERGRPAYKSPWLWSAVGAAVVGAVVAGVIVATRDRSEERIVARSDGARPTLEPLMSFGARR